MPETILVAMLVLVGMAVGYGLRILMEPLAFDSRIRPGGEEVVFTPSLIREMGRRGRFEP